ncbi:MAG: response regulator [Alphaproteobacteria bacterium]|nr:response regulator [Alphaproteobacteria bacterium]
MRTPARILIADDNPANVDILAARLESQGYEIVTAFDGAEALAKAREQLPDLILLDVMMPKMDGFSVCRELKGDDSLPFMPIILVTAKTESQDIVEGLDAGGDEYLAKPVDHAALVARVRSILRIKEMHDTIEAQSAELQGWNRELETRVAAQVTELERIGRLKRFLSPQVADMVVEAGEDKLLESHRREITVVFCDLRGFTAFSEITEPEDVMRVLGQYHDALGAKVHEFEGTVEHFAGDGVMILFNDPLPCPDHAERAVRMSVAMHDSIGTLVEDWRKMGYDLGFGIGIAQGYATLGRIGFEGRFDYAAIGSVVNLASRLSDEAEDGQTIISEPVWAATESITKTEPIGLLELKGLHRPINAFNVTGLETSGDGPAAP